MVRDPSYVALVSASLIKFSGDFSGKDTKAERHRTISRILQQLAAPHLQFELQNRYLHDKVLQSVTYKRTDDQKLGMKV